MYKIIAANDTMTILEKGRKIYTCVAHTASGQLRESDLKKIEPFEVDVLIEKYRLLRHDPTTQIRSPDDWPPAHRVYKKRRREQMKLARSST